MRATPSTIELNTLMKLADAGVLNTRRAGSSH